MVRVKIAPETYILCHSGGGSRCGNCKFRKPWQDLCSFFNTKIEKGTHGGTGFHHYRSQVCIQAEKEYDGRGLEEQNNDYNAYRKTYGR